MKRLAPAALVDRHRAFWAQKGLNSPLCGVIVGAGADSWSYWQTNTGAANLWHRDSIRPEDLDPAAFVEDQCRYFELTGKLADDLIRTAIPFASFPWAEAALGCRISSTDSQIVSSSRYRSLDEYTPAVFDPNNPWVKKYVEFLDVYAAAFKGRHPVGQSVLRGTSDLLVALFGAECSLHLLISEPAGAKAICEELNLFLTQFIEHQLKHIPVFEGGRVIGQYEIWAPGTVARIQEDNAALLSPDLYRQFFKGPDARLAEVADYTLLHVHTSSLFLIDDILELDAVELVQVSKDEGHAHIRDIVPHLVRIQHSGRCLLVKGRITPEEISVLKAHLDTNGLFVQVVEDSLEAADKTLALLRNWH